MATFHRFEELEIWQVARKLSLKIFKIKKTQLENKADEYKAIKIK